MPTELIEHKLLAQISTWHGECLAAILKNQCNIPLMKKVHIIFHDAGGGHRNAAVALQTVIAQQQRPWQVELIQFQELTDKLDVLRRLTGVRIQEQYNTLLQKGWTLGATTLLRILQATIRTFHTPMVRLLEDAWRKNPADLLVSVIPHFNREICESWNNVCPGKPFVTIITDLADFPPHFWIEPIKEQYVIAGTLRAVDQAHAIGHDNAHIFPTSGMVLRPDFYIPDDSDRVALRHELGLNPNLTTAIVLFGGHGSKVMFEITERLDAANLPVQLILICGRNEALAAKLKGRQWRMPVAVLGFTKEVHKWMRAADFFIGKPGPGSIAEAMVRKPPVLIECNAWTPPQERYNTEWVLEQEVGIVLKSFKEVVAGVKQMLNPTTLAEFQRNVGAQNNQAVFEIPEILAKLLREPAAHQAPNRAEAPSVTTS